MGLFDLPKGELELLMDGKWKSVAFLDAWSKEMLMDEINRTVEEWSKKHEVTAARYNSHTWEDEIPVIYWKKEGATNGD